MRVVGSMMGRRDPPTRLHRGGWRLFLLCFRGRLRFLADVARQPALGERDEGLYIEATDGDGPKEGMVHRVPAFLGCSVNRIILY